MCEPVTVATVVGAGAVLGAAGQVRSGNIESRVMRNNAILADYQRNDAIQRGAYDARNIEIEGRRMAEGARTALAAGNVEGGVVDNAILAASVGAAEDATRARANAARAAWGFGQEARDRRTQAKLTKTGSFLGAAGTLLGGAGSAASAYASFK